MGLVSDFKAWRRYRNLVSLIEAEDRVYDVRITLLKGLKALAYAFAAAVATAALNAALAFLANPTTVSAALSTSLSPALVLVLVPIITALAHAGENYSKNKD